MSKELTTNIHALFGVLAAIAAVMLFIKVKKTNETSTKRIKILSIIATISIWLSYIFGGYLYVNLYAPDKAIIKASTMSWAHYLIMETKEHAFFILLLLSTYLSIIILRNKINDDKNIRKLILTISFLIIFLVLGMGIFGRIVTKGVEVGLIGGI